ncbi:hypothetical protein HDU86_003175 [Geranomyces michiganensis]|nr:hypothetical protein HDU86_003175 [Geranomyces michiganensis]
MTAAPTASPVAPVVPHKRPRENADGNPSASKKPTSNAVTLSKKLSKYVGQVDAVIRKELPAVSSTWRGLKAAIEEARKKLETHAAVVTRAAGLKEERDRLQNKLKGARNSDQATQARLDKLREERDRLQNELEAARNAAALQTSTAAIPVVEMVDQEEEEWQSLMEKLTPQREEDEPANDGERLHDIPNILTEWRGYEVMKNGLSADVKAIQPPCGTSQDTVAGLKRLRETGTSCGFQLVAERIVLYRFYNSDAPDALKKKMLANIADDAAETDSNGVHRKPQHRGNTWQTLKREGMCLDILVKAAGGGIVNTLARNFQRVKKLMRGVGPQFAFGTVHLDRLKRDSRKNKNGETFRDIFLRLTKKVCERGYDDVLERYFDACVKVMMEGKMQAIHQKRAYAALGVFHALQQLGVKAVVQSLVREQVLYDVDDPDAKPSYDTIATALAYWRTQCPEFEDWLDEMDLEGEV